MPIDSDKKIKTLKTIRGKDIKIRYTQDNFEESLVNQRQFYDESGERLTPVTPKLLERQVETNNPVIPRLGGIEPRTITMCFGSAGNVSGESKFRVIIPYTPGDIDHNEHITELLSYVSSSPNLNPSNSLSLLYQGEGQL